MSDSPQQRPRLSVHYPTAEDLEQDARDNLNKRRVFIQGRHAAQERTPTVVYLVRDDTQESFEWPGEVVWISHQGPMSGTGVELAELSEVERERLDRFVAAALVDEDEPTRNIHDRVRRLNTSERDKLAKNGRLPERVALERHFGGVVWEALLQNPQLTQPEVVRIAKNGSLPKPLVSLIVNNGVWLAKPEVRRALLGNPRVSGAHLDRVLQAMSQNERLQVARSTAYRAQVRQAAKALAK